MSPGEYQQLVEFLGPRFQAVDDQFTQTRDYVEGRFREVFGHFDGVYHRLERLEQEHVMMNHGMRRLEKAFAVTNRTVRRLEKGHAATTRAVRGLQREQAATGRVIRRIDQRITRLE
ncbi:MAG: hypothetical protein HY216_17800 [Candidatus Rokubacteria bacterium]|nr:hypothetical protein [Candidatus Rokubacteria bacterium]